MARSGVASAFTLCPHGRRPLVKVPLRRDLCCVRIVDGLVRLSAFLTHHADLLLQCADLVRKTLRLVPLLRRTPLQNHCVLQQIVVGFECLLQVFGSERVALPPGAARTHFGRRKLLRVHAVHDQSKTTSNTMGSLAVTL
jgi:hypothetical protein